MLAQTTKPKKIITKTVLILSLVSLFNDIASEMLIPVMPMFLKQIGFTVLFIGILEGIAEAIAGLSKSYFGKRSDQLGKRLPFVQLGYTLSAMSKPMMAICIHPAWIFFTRTIDRLGKGIRTGARDAMLSEEATPATKGQVFGFNKSMDTIGAVIGPSIALIFLLFFPNNYRALFLWSVIPGIAVLMLTRLIRENHKPDLEKPKSPKPGFFVFITYWKTTTPAYKNLVTGLLAFALFNSSDVFLILKMKESGLSDPVVLGIYIFYNLAYALMAYPIGKLADKLGLKKIFLLGLSAFALVYIGFAVNTNLYLYMLLMAIYGFYAAATDGVSKAWISNVVEKKDMATAIGTYTGFQSIAALIASSFCGFLWYHTGAMTTFLITAGITTLVIIYFLRYVVKEA